PPQYQPEPIDCSSPVATILLDSTYCSLLALLVENVANICYRVHQRFAAELRPPCELRPLRVACWACQLVQYECQQPLNTVRLLLIHFATPIALWRPRCRRFSQLIIETPRLRHERVVVLPARREVIRATSGSKLSVPAHVPPADWPAELVVGTHRRREARGLPNRRGCDRPVLRRPAGVGYLNADRALVRQMIRSVPSCIVVVQQYADTPPGLHLVVRRSGACLPYLPNLVDGQYARVVMNHNVLNFLPAPPLREVLVHELHLVGL